MLTIACICAYAHAHAHRRVYAARVRDEDSLFVPPPGTSQGHVLSFTGLSFAQDARPMTVVRPSAVSEDVRECTRVVIDRYMAVYEWLGWYAERWGWEKKGEKTMVEEWMRKDREKEEGKRERVRQWLTTWYDGYKDGKYAHLYGRDTPVNCARKEMLMARETWQACTHATDRHEKYRRAIEAYKEVLLVWMDMMEICLRNKRWTDVGEKERCYRNEEYWEDASEYVNERMEKWEREGNWDEKDEDDEDNGDRKDEDDGNDEDGDEKGEEEEDEEEEYDMQDEEEDMQEDVQEDVRDMRDRDMQEVMDAYVVIAECTNELICAVDVVYDKDDQGRLWFDR